jgi:hypothetical protein
MPSKVIIMFTPGFLTVGHMVQRFKCYRERETDRQTEKDGGTDRQTDRGRRDRQAGRQTRTQQHHGGVSSVHCTKVSFPQSQDCARYIAALSACPLLHLLNRLTDCHGM